MQVLFLLEPLEKQVSVSSIDIPVKVSQVISEGIFPVIGKFDART
jgi:hypothetical protein